jgi:hypothetical protein
MARDPDPQPRRVLGLPQTALAQVFDSRPFRLEIHNPDKRPRVELPQPLLSENLVEVMLGPKGDEAMKDRMRAFLYEKQLAHVPMTAAAARSRPGETHVK